jgi:hypothetical protein
MAPMRARFAQAMLTTCILGVVGCNGGSAPPPPTASGFCEKVETIRNQATMECYGGTAADWPIFFGRSTCPMLDAAITNGRLTYDPSKAADCLAQLSKPVACTADSPEGPSCVVSVLAGGVADGQPCESDYLCHAGSACTVADLTDGCPAQTCRHIPVAGEKCALLGGGPTCAFGASCVADTCVANAKLGDRCGAASDPGCDQNLYCAIDEPAPTCKRDVVNGPCVDRLGCFDYQYCDSTHQCHDRLPVGADCSTDPTSCQSFTACDPTTHLCVEASHVGQLCGNLLSFSFLCQGGTCQPDDKNVLHCVVPAADDAPCANGYECASGYCAASKCATRPPNDGASCADDTLCATGTCSADGLCADGSPCSNGVLCTSGVCAAGKCAAPSPSGAACAVAESCASGVCSGGICVTGAADGAPCTQGSDCVSSHCAAGTCAACM